MKEKNEMTQETKEENKNPEEISLDDLDSVAGGFSLRDAEKVKTTEISGSTISKI